MESATHQETDEDFLSIAYHQPGRYFFNNFLHEGFQLHITGLDSN